MDFRDSLSRLKKKVKHGLTGKKPKPKKAGIDAGEESAGSTSSRPASEARIIVGGSHDQGGKGPNAGGDQVLSTIRLPQPDEPGSTPASGNVDDQGRRGADVDVEEVEQAFSRMHSADVEVGDGSGPSKGKGVDGMKVKQIYPSQPTTSIPHDGKPDST